MKILFFLISLFAIQFSLFAEKGIAVPYIVDSTVYRSSIPEGSSKVHFSFKNVTLSKNLSSNMVIYAVDNVINETATLGNNNEFEISLSPGKHQFKIYYNPHFLEFDIYEIEFTSKHKTFVSLFLTEAHYQQVICDKPVIYLYPIQPTLVEVKVVPRGEFTFTYPLYENGWQVNANPDGNLTMNNQTYNYLFWESKQKWNPQVHVLESGFTVEKENVLTFLEDKLSAFGFNSKEKADFITFWGPQLIQNNRSLIHFMINDDCNEFAELEITPKPDHIYRFYMISMPLDEGDEYLVPEQEISPMDRNGFTVLEWGGSKITRKQLLSENDI